MDENTEVKDASVVSSGQEELCREKRKIVIGIQQNDLQTV
jgi:hypothetical protein